VEWCVTWTGRRGALGSPVPGTQYQLSLMVVVMVFIVVMMVLMVVMVNLGRLLSLPPDRPLWPSSGPNRLRPSFRVTHPSHRSKLHVKQLNLGPRVVMTVEHLLVPVERRRPTTGQEELGRG
jgi:hypothetical protein